MTQSRTGKGRELGDWGDGGIASRKFWKTDAFNTLCHLTQGAGQSSLEHEAPLAALRTYPSETSDKPSTGGGLISHVITVKYLSKTEQGYTRGTTRNRLVRPHAWLVNSPLSTPRLAVSVVGNSTALDDCWVRSVQR